MGKDKKEKKEKKEKKKSSRSRRGRSSSSSSSDEGLTKLELEKMKLLEEKIHAKHRIKECESLEEKRNRRIRKKLEKERSRHERMGWDKDMLGYTNEDNPFGDEKLLDTFVWRKKMDKDGQSHLTETEQRRLIQSKQVELTKDLEKVKTARLAREEERAVREREKDNEIREQDAMRFKQWSKQEETFHLEQARLRSKIRIKDGRATTIDLLARYLDVLEGNESTPDTELHEPYVYMNGLNKTELEDLAADILVYKRIDNNSAQATQYWIDVETVGEENLKRLEKLEEKGRRFDKRDGIAKSVRADIHKVFQGKSLAKLILLQDQVTSKISSGARSGTDVAYWESLANELKGFKAKVSLQEKHKDLMERIQSARDKIEVDDAEHEKKYETHLGTSRSNDEFKPPEVPAYSKSSKEPKPIRIESRSLKEIEHDHRAKKVERHCQEMYEEKCYTPPLVDTVPDGAEVIQAAIELLKIDEKRKILKNDPSSIQSAARSVNENALEDHFLQAAKQDMDADEAEFSVEAELENQIYKWADKYKPRKPRFFNRVHTGYEWNKYNQTHYDFDNPPPKIVQGYKMNIFYPDLIDKTVSPEYELLRLTEDPEFCILRIKAGPPYEDIAFKIVNREWDFGNKKGFRCQSMNGIFQLWFFYKRYRYRR